MIPTLRFVFDRKHVATRRNARDARKGLVQVELKYGKERRFLSTGVKVHSDQWDDSKRVINSISALSLNEILLGIERRINAEFSRLLGTGEDFSLSVVISSLEAEKTAEKGFLEWVDDTISEMDIAPNTADHYRTSMKYLKAYGKISRFGQLTQDSIHDFDGWLRKYHAKNSKKNLKQSTIKEIHTCIHSFVKIAMRHGLVRNDPYLGMKIKPGARNEIKYLTQAQLGILARAELKIPMLERSRDLFLFQTMTCLSYVDLKKMDFKRDLVTENGKYVIHDRRQKTAENYNIVLIPQAVAILEKYKNSLPIPSVSFYDRCLARISEITGLPRFSSHWARHSGAVLALNNGIPIEIVSKMLGHSNINTTQVYAKVLSGSVEDAYGRVGSVWSGI